MVERKRGRRGGFWADGVMKEVRRRGKSVGI